MQLKGEADNDTFLIKEHRHQDHFLELQTDDCLWVNMIWASFDLKLMDKEKVNNAVLMGLLKARIYNWEKPNDRLHQSTQVIHHSTAIHMCMLAKHLQLKDKVIDHLIPFFGEKLTSTIEGQAGG